MRRALLIGSALVLAGCPDQDPYSSAMEGKASCTVRDGKGTRCHEYTWRSPSDRTQLAATCTGAGSTFDEDARCADGAVAICVSDQAATHVYGDYTDLESFDRDCVDGGGTIEEAGGCMAAGGGGPAIGLLVVALRRRPR